LKVFASEAGANEWFRVRDPEGVAFEYDEWPVEACPLMRSHAR
jgi:hypothetical protein